MISEYRKLAQKGYKMKHDWTGKPIPWELWKTWKFDHADKWNMHKPKAVLDFRTLKALYDTKGSSNPDLKTRPSIN